MADTDNIDPADRALFVLDQEAWDEFNALLDQEREPDPALYDLLNSPTVFDT